jgi:hypothetical protein
VLTQEKEINGPPRYLTTDWQKAWGSVKKLQELNPKAAITGHGLPMFGEELKNSLQHLVMEFDKSLFLIMENTFEIKLVVPYQGTVGFLFNS